MTQPAMWTDVVDLRDFYATPLGTMARRLVLRPVRRLWPDTRGLRVMGLGFTTPYLDSFQGDAERVTAVMPASQGVLPWPSGAPNQTLLADESDLPLPDRSMDRILLVHAIESTENIRAMLRELWRILADGGRLIVVAPNRRGIWARLENTPFGNGRPFTAAQLSRLLRDNLFTPVNVAHALVMPPTRSNALIRLAPAFERNSRWFQNFAGVTLIEVTKQIYAGSPLKEARTQRSYLTVPQVFSNRAAEPPGITKRGPV